MIMRVLRLVFPEFQIAELACRGFGRLLRQSEAKPRYAPEETSPPPALNLSDANPMRPRVMDT